MISIMLREEKFIFPNNCAKLEWHHVELWQRRIVPWDCTLF